MSGQPDFTGVATGNGAGAARDDPRLADDLVVVLIFRDHALLYLQTGRRKNFPDFTVAHDGDEKAMMAHVTGYLLDQLGLVPETIERIGHIQKDPRDIMQYFINAHIYIYRAVLPEDQPAALPPDRFQFGWHDPRSDQQEGFSYKARLMLDFLRDWTTDGFNRLEAREVRDWYNAWMARHLQNAYREFIDQEIDECHAGDECLRLETEAVAGQVTVRDRLSDEVDDLFAESQQLADLIARTADDFGPESQDEAAPQDPDARINALETVKTHLCDRLHGLRQSCIADSEQRIAFRLIGSLLKRSNVLIDKYRSQGAAPGLDQELGVLIFDLESESLSPFGPRRG